MVSLPLVFLLLSIVYRALSIIVYHNTPKRLLTFSSSFRYHWKVVSGLWILWPALAGIRLSVGRFAWGKALDPAGKLYQAMLSLANGAGRLPGKSPEGHRIH